ncbi:prophage antirepressor-like protein [Atlantibacter sp. RC6]|nr:P22AR C-terminal domain-containing protein [Atlantibacter sp. RC6]MBB3320899.1 prophage antirepressor-like protein [Atlantibacter sp. RC6]
MVIKNDEAPTTCNSQGLLSNKSSIGNIDMNIVAKSDLNFQGKAIVPVAGMSGIWLSSAEIANALQYKSAKSVTNLFNQNADEFTSGMTQVIESVTSGNYRKKVRVFSLRGAHLIAMFARTDVAKEFRRWVLDILDREVMHSPIAKQFTDEEIVGLCYMQLWMEKSQKVCKKLYPALKQINSEMSGDIFDIANETRYMTERNKELLMRESKNLDQKNSIVRRAQPMLAKLRGEEWIH